MSNNPAVTRDQIIQALEQAINTIADMQRLGCPAGPVAIPSRIEDVLRAARKVMPGEG